LLLAVMERAGLLGLEVRGDFCEEDWHNTDADVHEGREERLPETKS
jgi:hypothetical protein